MKTVLSTKILNASQKELFLNSNLGLVEYNAIKIEFLDTTIPFQYQNYIITSKNTVKVFLSQVDESQKEKFKIFCVGEKTKALLEEHGLQVVETADYATDLADIIIKNYKEETFLFLCGNKRRDNLPETLSKNNVRFEELQVYKTKLNPRAFHRNFDGILFFSPSGIQSYLLKNKIGNSTLFCIGDTTAEEAKGHTKNIIVANKPTVENVLVQAIKHLKKHD
ncbi:MAG: uroporphyrinogen-III synthase [Muricauda sp.]|nr:MULTISPECIES: uroporphyrinogen-III synthase [unclassified Allomuricauda]MAU14818.1 uroporphyrinogen-III synthase [Allomuricauda sp.]|tara:strand:- start:28761 stop:29426 length:666 start_codon:yes stop_codon:yes gene_type:complete